MMVIAIAEYHGAMAPSVGPITEALIGNDPDAKNQLLEQQKEDAIIAVVFCPLGAIFYAAALLAPRKPWGWKLGYAAILAAAFPACLLIVLVVPALRAWRRPEVKAYFAA
jgi:hypothetical protein